MEALTPIESRLLLAIYREGGKATRGQLGQRVQRIRARDKAVAYRRLARLGLVEVMQAVGGDQAGARAIYLVLTEAGKTAAKGVQKVGLLPVAL